ncbi:hypothetical protein M2132_001961 [Dysgonomonas sp. PH5-45]|uniref:hypothetical protein n=1 Tax=unclassified Dysgonomonas TaxID=2630389 RepID=UPI002476D683|nr:MULTISPECIES: hypothetical protein [unclassified Dysgonomonas]MDH6355616.1 hypothetical protein [Dysgonomonas sp. PH5-45]MDH6388513.1 hypothetical protein [Dysgonomonas sp. PH5-37]
MNEYSVELRDNIEKICDHYAKNETFDFLQRIIYFMMECLTYHIPEKYFLISKKYIAVFIKDALKIWKEGGQEKELSKIRTIYINRMTETKPLGKIQKNKKENAVMNCMQWVLYNGLNDSQNQFAYDFLELFINELKIVEVKEEHIKNSLCKYFEEIIN